MILLVAAAGVSFFAGPAQFLRRSELEYDFFLVSPMQSIQSQIGWYESISKLALSSMPDP